MRPTPLRDRDAGLDDDAGAFYVAYNSSGDNSTVCTNFTVDPAQTRAFAMDNTPPPGGLARTIGFWKNWASCANSKGNQRPVLDQTLATVEPGGITIGTLILHGSTSTPNTAPDGLKAVQLLDKAGTCPAAVSAFNDAQTLLAGIDLNGIAHHKLSAAQATQPNDLATTLDRYNNNLLC